MKTPTLRHLQVLARRHGPAALVWRRRVATALGAISVGLVALLFAKAADGTSEAFDLLLRVNPWLPIVVTPLGFVLLAWLTRRWTPEGRGSGIPQVIAAASSPRKSISALISIRTGVAKMILTLGALLVGASVGREGPTVQISAAIMAWFHKFLRVPMRSGIIIAGGAAGVAAAFNTPLAGVAFAIEELANAFEQRVTLLVMTAILIAGIVSLGIAGDYVYFGVVHETLGFGRVLVVAPVAGVVGGLTGGMFAKAVLALSRKRRKILGPLADRPLILAGLCGLAAALIGITTGLTWGTGYAASRMIIEGVDTGWWFGPAKLAATLASAFAGLPGGIFSPSLATGAGFGNILSYLFPGDPIGSVVLLGMIGYFTGVVRAPLTAVIIVVEATASRGMILPLFASALIADGVSRLVCKEKLYHGLAREFMGDGEAKPA